MKSIVLPLLLILQIYGPNSSTRLVEARHKDKNTSRHKYGYAIKSTNKGSSQDRVEDHSGDYYVKLPNDEGHSKVQYVADNRGYQTVVRINTKNAHSRVFSHFALGKEAINALNKLNSSDNMSDIDNYDPNAKKLLTNEILPEKEMIFVTAPAIQPEEITPIPPINEGVLKLITNTSDMVSNEDVFNINGAAEEYFDDISDEKLKQSHFTFVDNLANDGFSHFSRPIMVDEIITNSLPRTGTRSLNLDTSEVLISPARTNLVPSSERAPTGNVNIEILQNEKQNNLIKFGDRIPSVTTEKKSASPVTLNNSPFEGTATTTEADILDAQTTTSFPETNTATGISESFLAPIQAGLLLFNDQRASEKEIFEDNVLSDSMQSDLKVLSEEIHPENADVEKLTDRPSTTLVESYRSRPIVEIIERGVENNRSTEVKDQTIIHAVETHQASETISSVQANLKPPGHSHSLGTSEVKHEKNVFIPSIPYDETRSSIYSVIPSHVYAPVFPPIPIMHIPVPVSYQQVPGNEFYLNHLRHYHPNAINENCYHCTNQIIKDDYYGPVPPVNDYKGWNNVNYRHQRQLPLRNSPKLEYGFKPPMRPSLEINDEGLPLVKNYH